MSGGPALETMRAFVALNLDVASVRALGELSRRLRARVPAHDVRWVASTKLHVTLKFLGPTDIGVAPALVEELRGLVGKLDLKGALRANLGPVSAFPSVDDARVLVVLVEDPSKELERLAAAVDQRVAPLGFAREVRAHRPHVTLARCNRALDAGSWVASEPFALRQVRYTEIVLYRSDQARSGAEYSALARWPLSGVST